MLRSKSLGSGGITKLGGCCKTTAGGFGGGLLGIAAWGVGGSGVLKLGAGRGPGEKKPGGGIPGGRAGKSIVGGAGGKGGVKLVRGRGIGANENGELLEGLAGIVCGRRPASAGVSSIVPTEPGRFFEFGSP